eukprot:1161621-Pelagomonas_calceolata.AAC.2
MVRHVKENHLHYPRTAQAAYVPLHPVSPRALQVLLACATLMSWSTLHSFCMCTPISIGPQMQPDVVDRTPVLLRVPFCACIPGFGVACMRNPDVVERTLAEVAGTLLTARLALQHGLAVRTLVFFESMRHPADCKPGAATWLGGVYISKS